MNNDVFSQTSDPTGAGPPSPPRPTHRILVVDDEPCIRQLNTEALLHSGYHVDAAADGAAAWDTLQLKSYHLLVTDNDMPNVTGVDLLKKLHAAHMALPVIMTTGTLPTAEFTRYPWLKPHASLIKPYTIDELVGTVREVLHAASSTPFQYSLPLGWRRQLPANGLHLI